MIDKMKTLKNRLIITSVTAILLISITSGIVSATETAYTGCISTNNSAGIFGGLLQGSFHLFNPGISPIEDCGRGDVQESFYNKEYVDSAVNRISTLETEVNNPGQFILSTSHGNITLAQIAEIQPGLGTVMMEYANRFWSMYYAANDGNWDLAAYQMKEALEIQEVGETTRPSRALALKAFETSFLVPLTNTINAKDFSAFQTAYNNTVAGCNGCHEANGFPFIKYVLPTTPPNIP
jgi:hypothetical protein